MSMPTHRARLYRAGVEEPFELARLHPDESPGVLADLEAIDAKHIAPILGKRVDEDTPTPSTVAAK